MPSSVLAVYENGVFRPTGPVELAEGQQVQLSIYPRPPFLPLRAPTPEEQEYLARLKAATTLQEMFAVMESAPPEPDYDIMKLINESRRLTGFRVPDPEPGEGAVG